jgi:hypothetical protein
MPPSTVSANAPSIRERVGHVIAYYVAFGPHGPRAPIDTPADRLKIYLYTVGLIAVTGVVYVGIHALCTFFQPPYQPPRSNTISL